ncbi:MAG: cytoskeletal protein binding protein, partial [Trizodia sp. TS-e1964]
FSPIGSAKALFDYTRQTDEEISFPEDAELSVYDITDPDWTLVGHSGEFGFAPANYIELHVTSSSTPVIQSQPPKEQHEAEEPHTPSSMESAVQSPAAALVGILRPRPERTHISIPAAPVALPLPPRGPQYTPEISYEDAPAPSPPKLPSRPVAEPKSHQVRFPSPPTPELSPRGPSPPTTPRGFHLYNVNEMISVLGKRKKMPTTLGINVAKGTILIAPEKSRDGDEQDWSAEKLTHYSIEGKHVFMELKQPSKSVDFHAGARDTALEIVAALGEIAGAIRAGGLIGDLAKPSHRGAKRGQVLYDFEAKGDDEVSVTAGDDVYILDDTNSEEWWQVRRLKNGQEGVVPSSYIELISGTTNPNSTASSRSIVEQNRLEEEKRTARDVERARRGRGNGSEVGPGMKLPDRASSLSTRDQGNSNRPKRESRSEGRLPSTKQKPENSKTRTWTDRSGSFKVEAQFIGLSDGKIHLHKLNGVQIAVPVIKMSVEDLEYVELVTGESLDEDKPLSDIRRQNTLKENKPSPSRIGASVVGEPGKVEYDWFDFFLKCGVGPNQCERYSSNFTKDSMDESVLPDISSSVLRTLGFKEGDILRVMKFLDNKYGRSSEGPARVKGRRNVSFGGAEVIQDSDERDQEASPAAGGLFSGPGGALKNNTRKGRPVPANQASDVVDPKVFELNTEVKGKQPASSLPTSPVASTPASQPKDLISGFDDDAWNVKPSKKETLPVPQPAIEPAAPSSAPLTGSMKELSILSAPLQPIVVHSIQPQSAVNLQATPQIAMPQNQNFTQVGGLQPNFEQQQQQQQLQQQNMPPRQRPQAPQMAQHLGALIPPPPPRPLSAPQNFTQRNGFGPPPLQQQLTGAVNYRNQPSNLQVQLAPPGQSLDEISARAIQQRQQQQFAQHLQPQSTGYPQYTNGILPQSTGFNNTVIGGIAPQPTGFSSQLQPGNFPIPQPFNPSQQQTGSPFGDPRFQLQSIGGYQTPQSFTPSPALQPVNTGFLSQPNTTINSFLPPALQPQRTGVSAYGAPQTFGQSHPPLPPIPQLQPIAPLQAQKTGPAPPVRFGLGNDAKKLTPQPTGRRANLSQATPDNPFGFGGA